MANPIHIGLVTDSDAFAGTERHILDLAQGLRQKGAQVSLFCPGAAPLARRAREDNFSVVAMEKREGFDLQAVRQLRSCLTNRTVDVLHAHNGRTALWAAMAKALSLRGSVVATQHFLAPAHAGRTGMTGLASRLGHRWVNGTLDHMIAISNAVRTQALERGGISSRKISVVHNGIRDPASAPLLSTGAVRAALGLGHAPLIVCTARLEPEKDLATLIRAFQRLPEPRPVCVIAGNGSLRSALEDEIRCRNLSGTVKLVGFQADALSLINAADVFVLPSLAEPFGLAILEAMALGKPVIATNAGGPPEIVMDQATGLLIPPGNDDALAQAIHYLVTNPDTASAYGRAGRARYLSEFTVERMVAPIGKIYSTITGQRFRI